MGGTIEYGEDSKSAVVREVKEEIDVDIIRPRLIGLIENIFPYYNEVGHEYDFIYEAEFCSPDDYDREVFEGVEGDKTFAAVWMNLSDFADNPRYMLVPEGLYDMLARKGGAHAAEILHLSTRDYVAFESK
ncbi:8-oxo-dGTP pyrophosphatase MutT (NUDIX family) [Paenibacillus sacheonensis]|nr:8-oxo-dGTP pyrophosphatase MutT (NUDIX family) [Paenibacillus sacheonensis]